MLCRFKVLDLSNTHQFFGGVNSINLAESEGRHSSCLLDRNPQVQVPPAAVEEEYGLEKSETG